MKPVLMENAFEAWAAAIRFCDDIKDGKATLQYQKNFVLSLHNAVELIMKQRLRALGKETQSQKCQPCLSAVSGNGI